MGVLIYRSALTIFAFLSGCADNVKKEAYVTTKLEVRLSLRLAGAQYIPMCESSVTVSHL